ncbi:MAG: hypothetical protein LBF80_01210 [Spirochaetaceae bacterium]|jgi:hypothetical protein|nr:hypothetical protein [Spirochaetaceae bacterium]
MWQNVKSFIGFLCIFIYITVAAVTGINIYKAVNEQRFEVQQELADLTDFASRAGALGFFTDDYAEDIKSQLDISKSIDALIIYGPGSKNIAFEKKSGLISYKNDYPDFAKKLRLYRAPQTLPIRTGGNLNVSINALSPLMDFNALHSLLRSSLLAILIAVVAGFTTLIVDVSIAGNYVAGEEGRESSPNVIVLPDKTADYSGEPEPAAPPPDEETFDIDAGEPEPADPPEDEESFEIEAGESDKAEVAQSQIERPPDENEAAGTLPDENEAAAAPPEIDSPPSPENPIELFSELPQDESSVKNEIPLAAAIVIESPPDENETAAVETETSNDGKTATPEIDSPPPRENPIELFSELPPRDESAARDEIPLATTVVEEEARNANETAPDAQESAVLPGGEGLLAAASALYETDNFDSIDDDAGFPDILQSELNQAEKSGKDITLLDMEWSVGGLSSDTLVKQAQAFFRQGSRFFEKESGEGVYIIVPDGGLDEIFSKAKEFHKGARAENHAEFNAELLIGLSSRSVRSVDAKNLLNEAERALAKARADIALPIVAFKVDPQKYKDFVSKKRKTA